jgi:hypothetical protein
MLVGGVFFWVKLQIIFGFLSPPIFFLRVLRILHGKFKRK